MGKVYMVKLANSFVERFSKAIIVLLHKLLIVIEFYMDLQQELVIAFSASTELDIVLKSFPFSILLTIVDTMSGQLLG